MYKCRSRSTFFVYLLLFVIINDYLWFYVNSYLWLLWLFLWLLLIICNYKMIICDSVVCINVGSGQKTFREGLEKLMLLLWKLLMSSINRVRKLPILYFSRKNKEIKKLKKMAKIFWPWTPIYTYYWLF